jgi:hypothetical protein
LEILPVRRFTAFVLTLAFILVVPAFALAKGPVPSETISTSRPLPTHVNEHSPLTGSVRIKHMGSVGTFCFDVNFVDPGLNIDGFGFFIAIDDRFDHAMVKPPYRYDPNPEPVYNPLFQQVCTTDPVNIAAVRDGRFTFHLTTNQGSFDVEAIHTSYSPPA